MKMGVIAGAAALAIAGFASAGFVGFEVENLGLVNGKSAWKVYAKFNSANDVVLNVFNVTGVTGSFNQADFAGGSWAPQFTSNPTEDSYVTVGGTPGFSNSTTADPNWGGSGFNQPGIPNGAGWFNNNPPNLQGKVDGNLRTLIAQFVFTSATPSVFTGTASVGFNQGLGTPTVFGNGSFTIPAPGAVALLGLAGLAGRRRRA
ncbi:MAG: hypothetical protein JNM94_09450 [Phycisphaerae bacterium]|nr:hypothetical protein [Phycisphaerae bacterium]